MDPDRFQRLVQEAFDDLPEKFRDHLENVHVVVDDLPPGKDERQRGTRSGTVLLGLYHGVPLSRRGADYGVTPVVPDRITLFRLNIEAVAHSDEEVRDVVRDTLIHEIGHYYGMTEAEIRKAGY